MNLDELPLELLLEMQERMVDSPLEAAADRALKREAGLGFYLRHTAHSIIADLEPPIPMHEAPGDVDSTPAPVFRLSFSSGGEA